MAGKRDSIRVVNLDELQRIWNHSRMPEKRTEGVFVEVIAHEAPAGDPRYHGGTSVIVKLLTANGRHIGTAHEIVMPDGSVPHSHPKDYTNRDCSRLRAPSEPHPS